MPTVGDEPCRAARPCGAAASTTAPQRTPAPTRAQRATGSIVTPPSRPVRTSIVWDKSPSGPGLWAPLTIATLSPSSAARRTEAPTSSASAGMAMAAGFRSSAALNEAQPAAYPSSPGRRMVVCRAVVVDMAASLPPAPCHAVAGTLPRRWRPGERPFLGPGGPTSGRSPQQQVDERHGLGEIQPCRPAGQQRDRLAGVLDAVGALDLGQQPQPAPDHPRSPDP